MKRSVVCILLVAGLASVAFPSYVTVKNITFNLPGTFYYVNSEFVLNAAGSADIQSYGAPASTYDYAIENLSISITPCPLFQDQSIAALGWAKGAFYGGGVLTVTGDLMAADNGNPIGPVLASGAILQADMVPDASGTWLLQEIAPAASIVSAVLGLTPDGSNPGINAGLDIGGGDTMIIGDMNFSLQFTTPGISGFGTGDYQSSTAPVVQIAAEIPEPATLLLLSIGTIGLISRRKK